MPHLTQRLVLHDCICGLSASQGLARAARQWCLPSFGPKRPKFSTKHRDMLVELAFLRVFLAWEAFLEESFVLYLLGKAAPKPYLPTRLANPPTRKSAILLTTGGHRYADWADAEAVRKRAASFFRNGRPYEKPIRSRISLFENMHVLRNALVHRSYHSQTKFQVLVRDKLGSLPFGMTVGQFLESTVPGSSPLISFFELYASHVSWAARQIVPK